MEAVRCLVPFSLKINTTNLLPNCRHFIQDCGKKCFLYILHPLQLTLQCMTHKIFRQLKMNSLSMICPFLLQLQKLQSFSQQSLKLRTRLASVGWRRGEYPWKVAECTRSPLCCSGESTHLLMENISFRSGRF